MYVPIPPVAGSNPCLVFEIAKEFFLTIKRILRCHPWGGSGYDPVP